MVFYTKRDYYKFCQETTIKKTSSGLGFFVFAYFATMIAASTAFSYMFVTTGTTSMDMVSMLFINIFVSVFSAFIPGLFYFLVSGRSVSETIKTSYVRQNELWALVFIGMSVAMISNIATNIIQTNFSFFGIENSVNMSENVTNPLEIILCIVSTAIVPAFAEEFAFRGIFMGTLRKFGDTFAIITSAIVFGAMHRNISQIPFAFLLGLVLAYVDCKTNSIIPSIIIHFLNNCYAVTLNILQSMKIFNDRVFMIIYFVLIAAFSILGLLSFFYLIKKDKNYFRITEKNIQHSGSDSIILLTLKEKITASFVSPGILFVLIFFAILTLTNLRFV